MAYHLSIPVVTTVTVFVLTLLPAIYEKIQQYFFQLPDDFLHYVNTTLVPRFGDNGGILVLTATKFIVLLMKTYGHVIIFVGRNLVVVLRKIPEFLNGAKASFVNGFFQLAGIILLLNVAILVLSTIFKAILKKLI